MKPPRSEIRHGGRRNPFAACLAFLTLLPTMAFAHPGHYHPPGETDEFDSFAAGFQHPFSGFDHMALALAIGWLALSLGGRKALVPGVSFLTAILAGALAGRGFSAGAGLEIALACTLIGTGLFFLVGRSMRFGLLSAAAGVAGLIHGFAHGAEAMSNTVFGFCVVGFIAATTLLFSLGGLIQRVASVSPQRHVPHLAGCALLVMGSLSLFNAI